MPKNLQISSQKDNRQKSTFTLTKKNVLDWGFDLLATLTDPRHAYPIQVLFIRCGPYAGRCQVFSGDDGQNLKNFPIIDATPSIIHQTK